MRPLFLFPYYLKRIGWLLTLPTLVLGLLMMFTNLGLSFFEIHIQTTKNPDSFFSELPDLTDEVLSILLIIGLNLVAFSKEKIEDEWVSKTRLESLQWGVYINSAVLVLATIFLYELDFLTVMMLNLFTVLIFFIIRFNFILYIKPLVNKNRVNAF